MAVAGSSRSRASDRVRGRPRSRRLSTASRWPIDTTGGWLTRVTVASDPATVAKSEAATAR